MNLEAANDFLEKESSKHSSLFVQIPKDKWPHHWNCESGEKPFSVLRNRRFLVQLYRGLHGMVRMSVNKCQLVSEGRWADGITWDELQNIKDSIGYGHKDAVEVYPRTDDIVNVANIRHLFILPIDHKLDFIWRKNEI